MSIHSVYVTLGTLPEQNGIPLTDPNYYATITKEKCAEILKSDSEYDIPMFEERFDVLREAGKKLLEVNPIYLLFLN